MSVPSTRLVQSRARWSMSGGERGRLSGGLAGVGARPGPFREPAWTVGGNGTRRGGTRPDSQPDRLPCARQPPPDPPRLRHYALLAFPPALPPPPLHSALPRDS